MSAFSPRILKNATRQLKKLDPPGHDHDLLTHDEVPQTGVSTFWFGFLAIFMTVAVIAGSPLEVRRLAEGL